jgi:hypothetical protein
VGCGRSRGRGRHVVEDASAGAWGAGDPSLIGRSSVASFPGAGAGGGRGRCWRVGFCGGPDLA